MKTQKSSYKEYAIPFLREGGLVPPSSDTLGTTLTSEEQLLLIQASGLPVNDSTADHLYYYFMEEGNIIGMSSLHNVSEGNLLSRLTLDLFEYELHYALE